MARIHITTSGDSMQADAQLARGPAMAGETLAEALAAANITHGIDAEAAASLTRLLGDPEATARKVIARGTPPVRGRDGQLTGRLLSAQVPGKLSGTGTMDYHERNTLLAVTSGQPMANIEPPGKGTPGKDVLGRAMPAESGTPFPQKIGPSARRDGHWVLAAQDGVVLLTPALIDVVPLYTHQGNVDYHSGNLHTAGSLLVVGDVEAGFEATADGDISVNGGVDGGLQAGGSVLVARGISGHQEVVRAEANIECLHATASRLIASRAIRISDQATQATLQAPMVTITEGRASVRGGTINARDRIEVGTAGAPAGTETVLAVGQLLDERGELARRTAATSREVRIAKGGSDRGRSGKGLRNTMRASDRERSEQLRLRRRQRELLGKATIRITRTCYAGVLVRFGGAQLLVESDQTDVLFRYDLETNTIIRETTNDTP